MCPRPVRPRRPRWLLAGLVLALLPSTAGAAVDAVVVISLDGMRWDYPRLAGAQNLARLAKEGAAANQGMIPPFPASTFPAHATLLTGVYADRHGILNNEFLDRARGLFRREDDASWLLAEPIWATAERQGLRAAVSAWVCSGTPWHGIDASIRIPFSAGLGDAQTIDRIIGWLRLGGAARPRLVLAYLHGPDGAGHRLGPNAPGVMEAVRRGDRLIGRLVRAIERSGRSVALLVVSDHGMSPVSTIIRTDRILSGAARRVLIVPGGATANIYCRSDREACAAAASSLRRVAGLVLYTIDRLPEDLRYRLDSRTGDLVAIAPPGSYFSAGRAGRASPARGMHGYGPDAIEMHGIFYAWGAGIRRGARIDRIRAVDIDPLICRLLGIDPPAGLDGRVPDEILETVIPPASRP